MVEGNLEASRPKARRPRQPASAQKQAADTLYRGLDRFGLAPILLLALAYLGHTQVVQPIASAYMRMVAQVGDTNEMMRKAVEENNREDMERVAAISAAQALNQQLAEENRALNTRILEALATADAARREIHDETREVLERVLKALDKGEQK
jgi:hypothetical protein